MVQRRSQTTRNRAAASREKTQARTAAKPVAGRDVTQYADKAPTAFHKFFARWIVEQVGYTPEEAKSKRAAFLAGVSIATAARQAFQASPELAEWREETGETKRGPKPKDAAETKRRAQRQNVSDEEFEPEDDDTEEETEEGTSLEEDLNGMAIGKLRATAKEYGVTAERGWKKDDFIDAILSAAEEDDTEEDDDSDEDEIDLDELADELDALSLTKVKARAKEYDVTPKRGETKEDLIERILDSLEDSEDEDDDEPEEEEEDAPPAKSRARAGGSASASSGKRKAKPADDEDDDEFIF